MSEKVKFISFRERPDWKDVEPIPQDDGPNPVCRIAYDPKFSETMDYFRAIIQKNEKSARALQLTTEVIQLNAANYTAWYYRRLVLDELHADLQAELDFVTKIGSKSPKNYQIWHHRRAIVEKLQNFSQELDYTAQHINEDSKNYHAWAHRQWVVEANQWWDQELEFTNQLLKEDMRNNSSWNQRYFVLTHNKKIPITSDIREREIEFAFSFIRRAPNNQSPWTFLKGLFQKESLAQSSLKGRVEEFYAKHVTSAHAASILLDIALEEDNYGKAIEYCQTLANSLDTLHKKYWMFRLQQIENRNH